MGPCHVVVENSRLSPILVCRTTPLTFGRYTNGTTNWCSARKRCTSGTHGSISMLHAALEELVRHCQRCLWPLAIATLLGLHFPWLHDSSRRKNMPHGLIESESWPLLPLSSPPRWTRVALAPSCQTNDLRYLSDLTRGQRSTKAVQLRRGIPTPTPTLLCSTPTPPTCYNGLFCISTHPQALL